MLQANSSQGRDMRERYCVYTKQEKQDINLIYYCRDKR